MVGVQHPTRRKNEGKKLGRHLELSERPRAFARKKRQGERMVRKTARMKHKATRARSRLDELTFGTFNVRTAAVNGVNGIGHIDTLCYKGCHVAGLQETNLNGSELSESWHLNIANISAVIAAG